jgi:quinol monooxygenase YgiN
MTDGHGYLVWPLPSLRAPDGLSGHRRSRYPARADFMPAKAGFSGQPRNPAIGRKSSCRNQCWCPPPSPPLLLLLPTSSHQAAAQSPSLQVNAVDIDIVPGQIDAYLAALKENGAASVKEPGCHEFDITVSQKDPNHVLIIEVYDDAAAAAAHRETDHLKKYAAATKELVAKRELRILSSVAMNMKGQ